MEGEGGGGIMDRALLLRRGACAILTLAIGWIMDYIRLRKGWEEICATPPLSYEPPPPSHHPRPHAPATSPLTRK